MGIPPVAAAVTVQAAPSIPATAEEQGVAPTQDETQPQDTRPATPRVVAVKAPTARAVPRQGLTIYLDCIPTKRGKGAPDTTSFEDWLAPISEFVAEQNDVIDYRLIEYGKGKALLAAEIRKRIVDVPPVLVISSMSPGAHEVIETLVPYADVVVKALRG
jgi:hypothetical protein